MVTNIPKIQFRVFVRDFLGIGMYYLFWFILLRLPIASIMELNDNLPKGYLIFFKLALAVTLIILFCFLLRYLAKGVVQGRMFCLAIAGFCFLALGCYLIFSYFASVVHYFVYVLLGIFAVIVAGFFFFLTISPGQADSHGT